MFANMHNYMKIKHGNLPHIQVTKEKLIEMLIQIGQTKEDAEEKVYFAEQLGSYILIGQQMVGIEGKC